MSSLAEMIFDWQVRMYRKIIFFYSNNLLSQHFSWLECNDRDWNVNACTVIPNVFKLKIVLFLNFIVQQKDFDCRDDLLETWYSNKMKWRVVINGSYPLRTEKKITILQITNNNINNHSRLAFVIMFCKGLLKCCYWGEICL